MSKFGNINTETLHHLEIVLEAVRGEIGHPLEKSDPALKLAERRLVDALKLLEDYRQR